MHAEHITGEENAGLAVQREHRVWPMQIRSHHKIQYVPLAKVQRISSLHPTSHQKTQLLRPDLLSHEPIFEEFHKISGLI